MGFWIGEIVFAPGAERKINAKHDVTAAEVHEAVAFGAAEQARLHRHEVYGERLLAIGTTYRGRRILVTLKMLDRADGRWECKTARDWKGR